MPPDIGYSTDTGIQDRLFMEYGTINHLRHQSHPVLQVIFKQGQIFGVTADKNRVLWGLSRRDKAIKMCRLSANKNCVKVRERSLCSTRSLIVYVN